MKEIGEMSKDVEVMEEMKREKRMRERIVREEMRKEEKKDEWGIINSDKEMKK